ncbi:MAG: hypothetical protein Q9227_005381 [Pyrenula ochraceoflavens]
MDHESASFSPYRSDGKLYGFVCVVTGVDKPVGQAIAIELAGQSIPRLSNYSSEAMFPAHGAACIYTCSQTTSNANSTVPPSFYDEISKSHPNTRMIDYPYSISNEQDTLSLIDEALNAWGRLDVWVCSSGLLGPPSIDATTPADLQKCFEANSLAPFFALKYAPPAMAKTTSKGNYPNAAPKDQEYGSIIVVSSTASSYGGCWGPCFTMSSHAALGVVRAGVAALKGSSVRINCISPGQIDVGVDLEKAGIKVTNGQLPPSTLQSKTTQKDSIGLERAGTPAEVGRVAGFLASGFSSYITGANLVVDGGASVMCPLMVPVTYILFLDVRVVMGKEKAVSADEVEPLTREDSSVTLSRNSHDSISSASTTSLVLEGLGHPAAPTVPWKPHKPTYPFEYRDDEDDLESPGYLPRSGRPVERRTRRILWIVGILGLAGWSFALVLLLVQRSRTPTETPYQHDATESKASGKKVTLDQVVGGQWMARHHELSWISGGDERDGLLLEKDDSPGKDYLVVEDVRSRTGDSNALESNTLMRDKSFEVGGKRVHPSRVWPSKDLTKVLAMSDEQKNWRHSYTGVYWIFDVATQQAEPLDYNDVSGRVQLATWSPTSKAIVFTRENNMFIRHLDSKKVLPITSDGGTQLFYGIPDWVYEEEVFQTNFATWFSRHGKYIAYLRTNESAVPEYPIQYFVSRPSGAVPAPGEEDYPETGKIKYPKAGAPNPTVDLQFYDVEKQESFSVNVEGDFPDDDRLIIEVFWGSSSRVMIRETNRESDTTRLVLIDASAKSGKIVRTQDVSSLDGGWVEPSQTTAFIPADPENGRSEDGYIDTIVHDNYDHLAYFTPLDTSEPIMLTSGAWEVVQAPSSVDLKNNLVYFVATKEAPTQRHVYSVRLDGSDMRPLTDTNKPGFYGASFSKGSGYALIDYEGPGIPYQKVVSTPSNAQSYEWTVEENQNLAEMASAHEMPIEIYQTLTIDNYTLQAVERRPPRFNPKKKYPVIFWLYNGPGSQMVNRKFTVDFQAYLASSLGYIVVTVDGRGTGFIGREARCIVRGNLGKYEAHDQIHAAKIWASKPYVDPARIAIWGWSYGGFMTLKVLETDAGETFKYGMAVAPVTDWRYYDSIYTERYMHTPQHNSDGYDATAITDMAGLQKNVRFLIQHGSGDDNVHFQNTLTLLDKLDLAGVENYDVHVYPDSDHSIYFHNANRIVYDSKFPLLSFRVLRGNSLREEFTDLGLFNRVVKLAGQRV